VLWWLLRREYRPHLVMAVLIMVFNEMTGGVVVASSRRSSSTPTRRCHRRSTTSPCAPASTRSSPRRRARSSSSFSPRASPSTRPSSSTALTRAASSSPTASTAAHAVTPAMGGSSRTSPPPRPANLRRRIAGRPSDLLAVFAPDFDAAVGGLFAHPDGRVPRSRGGWGRRARLRRGRCHVAARRVVTAVALPHGPRGWQPAGEPARRSSPCRPLPPLAARSRAASPYRCRVARRNHGSEKGERERER
jgi:hypothetical protein